MSNRRSPDALNPADTAPATDNSTTRRPARSRKSPAGPPPRMQLTPEARHALIAEAAYLSAKRSGCTPAQEDDDR